jgi:2-desacetyl-2-hydroxyethyl bacteriochlorophyllide A dehydrogenase
MRAAIIHGPHDIRLETVDDPSIQDHEILVKVKACGICGTDLHTYRTGPTSVSEKPVILGHEWSGEIVEVGSIVQDLRVGDKVLGTGYSVRGEDIVLPGYGLDGAFAEYVVVPNPTLGQSLFRIPENLSWGEATTVEPVSVACHAVDQAGIQPEHTVVVLGAGMIGQGIAQAAKVQGASKVIASEPSPKRLAMAKKLGADVAVNPNKADPIEAVMAATSQKMANVVFECSGAPAAFCQALRMVSFSGRAIQVGVFEQDIVLDSDLMGVLTFRNLTLQGCAGQKWATAFELVRDGHVRTRDLITQEFTLNNAKEAFETQLNADESIKVLIKP